MFTSVSQFRSHLAVQSLFTDTHQDSNISSVPCRIGAYRQVIKIATKTSERFADDRVSAIKSTCVHNAVQLRWMSGWGWGVGWMKILGIFNMDSTLWHNFQNIELAIPVLQNIYMSYL